MSVIEGIVFEELNRESVMKKTPVLSVWCLTYNHVNYIRDCLDGILGQKTDFEFEVVIFDDASNDGTTDIVKEYCEKYPFIFHAFIAKENIYKNCMANSIRTRIKVENMRGEYAAICEGDDYWSDPDKLQIQVDFLRSHPNYTLVMHNARRVNYKTGITDLMKGDEPSHEIMPEEIIGQKSGIWPTASMVGKKEVWICEPFFFECGIGDWPMQLYAAATGRVYYMDQVMSVYRYMIPGSWSVNTVSQKSKTLIHSAKMIEFLCRYDDYTCRKFHDEIVERMNRFYYANLNYDKDENYAQKLNDIASRDESCQHKIYFKKMINLDRQLHDLHFINENIKDIAGMTTHIFIMGKGKYSDILTKQLLYNHVKISGYVLSDDQLIEDDNVISLSAFKESFADALLIVGVGVDYYLEILNNLHVNGINNYIFPFVIDAEKSWKG